LNERDIGLLKQKPGPIEEIKEHPEEDKEAAPRSSSNSPKNSNSHLKEFPKGQSQAYINDIIDKSNQKRVPQRIGSEILPSLQHFNR